MNVLSLFDGMSCGQIALRRAGIEYDNYFASEIDKYAIQITQNNYPDTIQLGDVTKIKVENLPKIDILIGGSPCVGFSFAGKQLAFNDPRSALFFEYVRLLKELEPKYFLFENVNMRKEHLHVISEYLGLFPVRINSNLVSAQNRDRWYWTNIRTKEVGLIFELVSDIPQPKDRKILLKNILQPENEVEDKYYIKKPKVFEGMSINGKCKTLRVGGGRSQTKKHNYDIIKLDRQLKVNADQNKAGCLTGGGRSGGNHSDMDIICINPRTNGRQTYQQDRVYNVDGKLPALTAELNGRNNILIQKPHGFNKGGVFKDKSPTLLSNSWEHNNHIDNGCKLRRLTPVECERLQTIEDNYTEGISNTQRYKMLGNAFTVDVIVHILKYLK